MEFLNGAELRDLRLLCELLAEKRISSPLDDADLLVLRSTCALAAAELHRVRVRAGDAAAITPRTGSWEYEGRDAAAAELLFLRTMLEDFLNAPHLSKARNLEQHLWDGYWVVRGWRKHQFPDAKPE